jgi:hypothetical protein
MLRCESPQEHDGQQATRQLATELAPSRQLAACFRGDGARDLGERRPSALIQHVLNIQALPRQEILRQVHASMAGMKRHGAQQAGERPGDPDSAHRPAFLLGGPEGLRRQQAEAAAGGIDIADQGRQVGRRRLPQVVLARVEEAIEGRAVEAVTTDGRGQWLHDLMAALVAGVDFGQAVAPPLQAHQAHDRLAHELARLGHLQVKGVERHEIGARLRAGEQRGQVAVAVEPAHLFEAIGVVGFGSRRIHRRPRSSDSYRPGRASDVATQLLHDILRPPWNDNGLQKRASGGRTMKKWPWENLHAALGIGVVLAVILLIIAGHYSELGTGAFWSFLFRIVHIWSGILWIGLLYYFNFVQIPSMPKIPDEQKPAIGKVIAPTALFFFRWAAAATVLFGLIIMVYNESWTNRGVSIGMLLGLIMAYNVWFIIWPNQQKALGLVDADADAKKKAARMAMLASRFNTMLSIPMLYGMVSAHLPSVW